MRKKFILALALIALLAWGVKKMMETPTFVEKVAYPLARTTLEKNFFKGNPYRVTSARLDSMWKTGVNKIILVPVALSDSIRQQTTALLKDRPEVYNDSTAFCVFPASSSPASVFVKSCAFPSLPLKGREIEYLFLDKLDGRILVADIVREKRMEDGPAEYWYLVTLEAAYRK